MRYPGSKDKLASPILGFFPDEMSYSLLSNRKRWEYREPFFGAGAIGIRVLHVLDERCSVWLNDIDPAMAAYWQGVRDHTKDLIRRISRFNPDPEEAARCFYQFKEEDGRMDLPIHEIAFRKLVLHQVSFSGLGAKAGGPIGGKNQDRADYRADCRWNPEREKARIAKLGIRLRKFSDFRFTCLDFEEVIRDAPEECFLYLDPPYVEKGPALYKHAMNEQDHARLCDLLRKSRASWVLSYDDHELVRRLYGDWARIEQHGITYTMASTGERRPKNHEVVITPLDRESITSPASAPSSRAWPPPPGDLCGPARGGPGSRTR